MRSVLRLGAAFVAALCVMCVSVFAGEGCSECGKRSNEDIIVLQRNMIARDNTSFKAEDVYNAAKEYIDSLAEDGSWKDIDYLTTPSVTFPAHAHIERLRMIARAYTIPNQPLFESEEAREAIERALPVVESKVLKMTNGVRQTPGNWWWWNLSIPPKLGFILASVEGKIDTEVYNTSAESIKWCLQHPMDWYLKGLTGQATNSVDAIKGNLYYSALTNNSANIEFIMSEFEKNLKVARVPFEGIAFDNAFIAHNMIDFYGYYSTTVLDTMNVLEYVKNTKYAPGDDVLDTFSACLLDGAFWTVYQNYRELGASGRSMYGPFTTNSTSSVMTGLRYLASFDNTYRDKAQSMLDKIESGYEANTGYKFFSSADFGVKKSDNSYVSVRMSSSRIKAAEAWGGNGQTNLFMGDGCMWIYNDAKKVYDTNMLAVSENRISGDVYLTVNWFDDRNAKNGSYWKVGYLTPNGARYTESVPYRYTDEWTTTVLKLENTQFSGTGLMEDGVELAIIHNNAVVDVTKDKYTVTEDTYSVTNGVPELHYGPIIESISLRGVNAAEEAYAEECDGIAVDAPCAIYREVSGGKIRLYLSNPLQNGATVNVTLDGLYDAEEKSDGVVVKNAGGKTVISADTEDGITYEVTLIGK